MDDDKRHKLISKVMKIYGCPSDGRTFSSWKYYHVRGEFDRIEVALSSYLGISGSDPFRKDGVFFENSMVSLNQILDGTSNTVCVAERPPSEDLRFACWYAGYGTNGKGVLDSHMSAGDGVYCNKIPKSVCQFWSHHGQGSNFLFCDGSVRFLNQLDKAKLAPLTTIMGGETGVLD